MDDGDEAVGSAALVVEPCVPPLECGDDLRQKRPDPGDDSCSTRTAVARTGGCVQSARGGAGRSRAGGGVPQLRSGVVVRRGDMEHDVRNHPVVPLALEQRSHLGPPAVGIDVRQPERDERRVPVPLVGVELASGPDERAHVIGCDDRSGRFGEGVHLRSGRSRGTRPLLDERQPGDRLDHLCACAGLRRRG